MSAQELVVGSVVYGPEDGPDLRTRLLMDRIALLESQRVTKELNLLQEQETQKALTDKIADAARKFLAAYDDPECLPDIGTKYLAALIEIIVRPRNEEAVKAIRRSARTRQL